MKKIKGKNGKNEDFEITKALLTGFADLGKYYLDKEMSINFHKDFKDLNPHYLKMRH